MNSGKSFHVLPEHALSGDARCWPKHCFDTFGRSYDRRHEQLEYEQIFATPSHDRRHDLGQFLTPHLVADFMVLLFEALVGEAACEVAGWRNGRRGAEGGIGLAALSASRHKPRKFRLRPTNLMKH